jgi:uncharacterized protein YbaP (TraB family)
MDESRNTRLSRWARAAAALLLSAGGALDAAADPAVWHVAGPRGAEIWLLGSIHVLSKDDHPLPGSVDRLFERADELVMELDLDDIDIAAEQQALLGTAVLPRGTVLRDVLPPGMYATAARRTRALGIDLALLENFEPWLVAITLLDLSLQAQGYSSQLGVEQHLVGKARAAGKTITGLESPAEQFALFDNLPADAQRDLLEQSLDELTAAGGEIRDITAAWRDGRLEDLSEELLAEFEQFPSLYEDVVVARNANWIAPLEALLEGERKVLVVVGALHLVGDDSVIAKLKARGHDVRRLEDVP